MKIIDTSIPSVSKLATKSKQAKREFQQLLEQAKTRVEQLIEEVAKKEMGSNLLLTLLIKQFA